MAGFYWITLRLNAMGRNGVRGHYSDRRNGIRGALRLFFYRKFIRPRMDHNSLPFKSRKMRFAPLERALRGLSNAFLMGSWGVLHAELWLTLVDTFFRRNGPGTITPPGAMGPTQKKNGQIRKYFNSLSTCYNSLRDSYSDLLSFNYLQVKWKCIGI